MRLALTAVRAADGLYVIAVAGAFALGIVVALTTEHLLPHPNWRVALGIGYLGSFTTFSTYTYESVKLAEDGAMGLALLNSAGMLAYRAQARQGGQDS